MKPNARSLSFGLLLAASAVACGGEAPKPAAPATPPVAAKPAPTVEKTATAEVQGTPQPVSPNVSIDSEIVRLCNLHVDPTVTQPGAPRFDFDQSTLTNQDKAVLDQVASCMIKGALAGRHVQLIGRADPRGTGEYNFVLGGSRAHTVSHYLEEQGVESPRLNETSRGSLDATGTDEDTWRNDRRVDIVLGS